MNRRNFMRATVGCAVAGVPVPAALNKREEEMRRNAYFLPLNYVFHVQAKERNLEQFSPEWWSFSREFNSKHQYEEPR